MSLITTTFENLKNKQAKALIPYVMAGDPALDMLVPILDTLVNNGADIIEIGVPFSDPNADGTTIQRSGERALANGVSLKMILEQIDIFRLKDKTTPLVLMTYLNPIEAMGYELFIERAKKAGIDGVLTVDLPFEEGEFFINCLKQSNLDPIFLLSPTSDQKRVEKIAQLASGFIYYVSLKGITGASHLNIALVKEKIASLRERTSLPIGVGFGIKNAEIASEVSQFADAVVIGSLVIETIEKATRETLLSKLSELISELRKAVDTGSGSGSV